MRNCCLLRLFCSSGSSKLRRLLLPAVWLALQKM
jgi:hypothetical protein